MSSVLLVYPYFDPPRNRSIFRFPPLGPAYVAASLRAAGHEVTLLDCTFLSREEALDRVRTAGVDVVGVYIMMTMRRDALELARASRGRCRLLIAGGPLPSCDPGAYTADFDVVVRGEGERTAVEVLDAFERGAIGALPTVIGPPPLSADLDNLPRPARDLLPNPDYLAHWRRRGARSTTSVVTTRGCPFHCEFCSNAVFGVSYRARSASSVLDEVQEALSYGFERIHFADDVFTLDRRRLLEICAEIRRRGLRFGWECLGRVDSVDDETAAAMKRAGCERIFFGIESGSDATLALMNKRITVEKARSAVEAARSADLRVGAFFILCYPGEDDEAVLTTLRFATRLPLDYLSFTMPYPLPHTALYERIADRVTKEWVPPEHGIVDHVRIYDGEYSQAKMRFAILKGRVEFFLRRRLGRAAPLVVTPLEVSTDAIFRWMR
jgi:anaerobic magnesium-protoporphyrin IX monomethyl ester cyclase